MEEEGENEEGGGKGRKGGKGGEGEGIIRLLLPQAHTAVAAICTSHFESSPVSSDECRLEPGGCRPSVTRLIWPTSTIAIYYYLARNLILILILSSHGGWKAEST